MAIQIEEVMFTGSPIFEENGTYWTPNVNPVNFVGEPSPEIDKNWDDLTWGMVFLRTRILLLKN
jgi:hypothetical protein